MQPLSGKKVLVTGASGGIGAHLASVAVTAGAHVTLAARRVEAMESVREAISEADRVCIVQSDVTDPDSVARLFADSGEPFDVIVNNAGVAAEAAALDLAYAQWKRVLQTNLDGAFLVSQAAARAATSAGRGATIVNIASILGLRVASHVAAYAASKAALVHLTKALALEWARYGIRVNALCPGYIRTRLNTSFFDTDAGMALIKRTPMRRLGELQDLDGPFLLLASDASRQMTGAVLAVDGGHLVSTL